MPLETVLIDSDAFVGWQIKQDYHHDAARRGFEQIIEKRLKPFVTSLVVAETVNLLSRRYALEDAKRFLREIEPLPVISIDHETYLETRHLFLEQDRKKASFVDMANVVVIRRYNIHSIFAFDSVYAGDFNLRQLTGN
jgi:predicted nucleic acid-binding protein